MPKPKEGKPPKVEPRYLSKEEAAKHGFFPDPPPPEYIEVYSKTPKIHYGEPYEITPGTIDIGTNETVELPPVKKIKAVVIEQDKKGEFKERPATSSEIGGGLEATSPKQIKQEVKTFRKRTHKKSSRKKLDLP